jgi:hypothetical protein
MCTCVVKERASGRGSQDYGSNNRVRPPGAGEAAWRTGHCVLANKARRAPSDSSAGPSRASAAAATDGELELLLFTSAEAARSHCLHPHTVCGLLLRAGLANARVIAPAQGLPSRAADFGVELASSQIFFPDPSELLPSLLASSPAARLALHLHAGLAGRTELWPALRAWRLHLQRGTHLANRAARAKKVCVRVFVRAWM